MKHNFSRQLAAAGALAFVFTVLPAANHSWGSYHWARTTGSVQLAVGSNLSGPWVDASANQQGDYLALAISDWNASNFIDLTRVPGNANPKNCRATAGRIEVCNSKYGFNGWLGIATIWASGSHISQATTKLNDSYFNTATYNTPAWRRLVMCQEIAHDFGLGHQDENFNNTNLGSCMDYTNDPSGAVKGQLSNEHPNSHDFAQLMTIYNGHTDSSSTASQLPNSAGADDADHPSQWGRLVHSNENGRVQVFELDLGRGNRIIRHVFWADLEGDRGRGHDAH